MLYPFGWTECTESAGVIPRVSLFRRMKITPSVTSPSLLDVPIQPWKGMYAKFPWDIWGARWDRRHGGLLPLSLSLLPLPLPLVADTPVADLLADRGCCCGCGRDCGCGRGPLHQRRRGQDCCLWYRQRCPLPGLPGITAWLASDGNSFCLRPRFSSEPQPVPLPVCRRHGSWWLPASPLGVPLWPV